MKALITGASSGIGRDMAIILSNLGVDVYITGRDKVRLIETMSMLNKDVLSAFIIADLSKEEDCIKLHKRLQDKNIDILINNAGFGECGEFTDTPLDKEIKMIKTNITAVHILTKLFLKDFEERDSGYILNVASSASFLAGPCMATYYATKNYVYRLSEAIYQELKAKESNVSVSILCPGPVDTAFNKNANVKFSLKGMKSSKVARIAIEEMFNGTLIIVPGLTMKFVKVLSKLLPEKTLLKFTYKTQRRKLYR
ncbi:MAG: SDR family NAD(P)-dependent oxidoreductase [Lachnospiraceae bacterium]|nr:SDR family NAD(P)-dependent oxidoreductase [Lachnospiraceae bacterium]